MDKKLPKPNLWSLINVTLCILMFLTFTIVALFQRKYIIGIMSLCLSIFLIRGFIRIYKVYNSNKKVASNK
ncbi:hypothetical protein [Clostridium sp.]|uniref:hypothetical protein n=1 Tax=Clostridium sp. TaxID=1506 RepID=UPI002FC75C86